MSQNPYETPAGQSPADPEEPDQDAGPPGDGLDQPDVITDAPKQDMTED